MKTCLRKSCSFGLPRVPFVNCCQFMYLVVSLFGFEGRMWDLIVSVSDHCLSFYFTYMLSLLMHVHNLINIHQLIHKILSINKILTLTLSKTSEK